MCVVKFSLTYFPAWKLSLILFIFKTLVHLKFILDGLMKGSKSKVKILSEPLFKELIIFHWIKMSSSLYIMFSYLLGSIYRFSSVSEMCIPIPTLYYPNYSSFIVSINIWWQIFLSYFSTVSSICLLNYYSSIY